MTNQVNLESAGTVSTQGVPTPAGGVVSGQPPSNGQPTFTAEQWAQVTDLVTRTTQATKDRRIQELENTVAELRQSVSSPSQVHPSQAQPASLANGAPQAAPQSVDLLTPVTVLGLNANDNEVLQIMREHGGNPVAYKAHLVDLKQNRLTQPTPPASAIPPSQGIGNGDRQSLINSKTAELQAALGGKQKDFAVISGLQRELAALSS